MNLLRLVATPIVLQVMTMGPSEAHEVRTVSVQAMVLSIREVGDDVFLLNNERAGVFRSTDGGRSWINIGGGLPNAPIYSFDIDPAARLWVCTAVGLYSSADRGATWRPVESDGWRETSQDGRLTFIHWVDARTVLAAWVGGLLIRSPLLISQALLFGYARHPGLVLHLRNGSTLLVIALPGLERIVDACRTAGVRCTAIEVQLLPSRRTPPRGRDLQSVTGSAPSDTSKALAEELENHS